MAVGSSNPSNFEYLSDERRTSYNISTIKLTKGAASVNVKDQGHEDQRTRDRQPRRIGQRSRDRQPSKNRVK